MLWTDAAFVTAADMTSLDNEVAAVASAESIDLTVTIQRATEEAGDALLTHMQEFGGTAYRAGDISANHYAAIMNTGLPLSVRSRILLTQVVVTGNTALTWTPLKRWVTYWALMLFYRDASNRTNNDRYSDKEEQYRVQLFGVYWAAVRAAGLPVVDRPLPCPGAVYEPQAGIWDTSCVSAVSGDGTVDDEAYDVVVTWVDSGRSSNGESQPSARTTVQLQTGQVLHVDISSLAPPTGQQPACTQAQAWVPYGKATGWHVYAGPVGGILRRQTSDPLPISQLTYTLAGDPATDTKPVGTGQWADRYLSFHNWNQRG